LLLVVFVVFNINRDIQQEFADVLNGWEIGSGEKDGRCIKHKKSEIETII